MLSCYSTQVQRDNPELLATSAPTSSPNPVDASSFPAQTLIGAWPTLSDSSLITVVRPPRRRGYNDRAIL